MRWITSNRRHKLYNRDNFKCVYCNSGASEGNPLSLDHIVCRSKGGNHNNKNLIVACHHCNSCRRDMSIADFQRYLFVNYGIKTKGLARKIRRLINKEV
jgi:5-methylcytosine-specific restriction endonuclease McrA